MNLQTHISPLPPTETPFWTETPPGQRPPGQRPPGEKPTGEKPTGQRPSRQRPPQDSDPQRQRPSSGQRLHLDRDPLEKEPLTENPWTENPWTENPRQRPSRQRTPDRDPLNRDPPRQRPPLTKTRSSRQTPLVGRPPLVVRSRQTPPPVDRQIPVKTLPSLAVSDYLGFVLWLVQVVTELLAGDQVSVIATGKQAGTENSYFTGDGYTSLTGLLIRSGLE